ncbi:MAG TPA: 23S rRNA (adenine(2503)-C(2))-methyltransferase RlmN [Candidatus Omnitrophota bacterium]|nr:23S rRNA (adenine(2503)-C(2))-methyltransferase RlmN [Candidatus Omnitrophota bacterium]
MQDIKELTLNELEGVLRKAGKPAFHARQIFSWIYKREALDFLDMSDLPIELRRRLREDFFILGLKIGKALESRDGTKKFLLLTKDKNFIEAVSIPQEKRITGCISSQVGCKFKCSFCASGLSGFKRNLTSQEMLDELLYLKNNTLNKKLTHIVCMGTGEPLDNYDSVLKTIRIINSPDTFNIGARRLTISTCGIIPGIKRLAKEKLQVELSVSLHAADNKTRSRIMPVNKAYPLLTLIDACRNYIEETGRQITFEYVLIKGINSDLQSAQNLVKILKGLNCKVNLIPVNTVKEFNFSPPGKIEILFFKNYLLKAGLNITLRKPRGQDIEAACGQLKFGYEKK